MIEITELTDKDKGRRVVYKVTGAKPETGTITSWNKEFIFVDYYQTGRGTATMPKNLTWDKDDVLLTGIEEELNSQPNV